MKAAIPDLLALAVVLLGTTATESAEPLRLDATSRVHLHWNDPHQAAALPLLGQDDAWLADQLLLDLVTQLQKVAATKQPVGRHIRVGGRDVEIGRVFIGDIADHRSCAHT